MEAHILPNRRPRKAFPTTLKTPGDHIQAGRVAKGLSQRELAKKLEVPKWLVKQWEEAQQTPTEEQWLSLGNILPTLKNS
jgi:ribosome-binding protein aMBF1 (putative translation factor)